MYRSVYSDKLFILEAAKVMKTDKQTPVPVQGIQNVYNYPNGKRTEEIIGKRVSVLCPDGKLLSVKMLNEVKDLDKIQIGMKIRFINLTGKIYVDGQNKLALSCSAEGWEEADV